MCIAHIEMGLGHIGLILMYFGFEIIILYYLKMIRLWLHIYIYIFVLISLNSYK